MRTLGTGDYSCVPVSPPFIVYLSNLTFKYDILLAVAETTIIYDIVN